MAADVRSAGDGKVSIRGGRTGRQGSHGRGHLGHGRPHPPAHGHGIKGGLAGIDELPGGAGP